MKSHHTVSVLGREISVKSSSSAENVKKIEEFVAQRLQMIGGALRSGEPQLVLSLALLNMAEELLDLQNKNEEASPLEERVQCLIDKITNA